MPFRDAPNSRNDVAIVVIGRNEGERLRHCLGSIRAAIRASVGQPTRVVYVDSGSSDGSVAMAREAGIEVVMLPEGEGFTAARARNAGLAKIRDGAVRYVQMIDGDCELEAGWIDLAAATLDGDPGTAAIFGRRRERFPDRSIYNRLCDIEWAVPPGEAEAFGGDVLIRRDAISAGYRDAMVAGEDVDLALRLREGGGRILCLPAPMTVHDAAIERFGQWWRRTARAGHAFAEIGARHGGPEAAAYRRSVARIGFWGGAMPLAFAAGLAGGSCDLRWLWLSAAVLVGVAVQAVRILLRERRQHPPRVAAALALFLTVGKYAEMTGLLRFHADRMRGRKAKLIEYKRGPAS